MQRPYAGQPAAELTAAAIAAVIGYTPENVANKSIDGTFAANSDTLYPSQKAVKTYVDATIVGGSIVAGGIDCSANPNYPAATGGEGYYVTVAGKVGGASGEDVEIGDFVLAIATNAGGTQAAVGSSWIILQNNLKGALIAANNLSDVLNAGTARTNLGLAIGTNVQAYNANLTTFAAITPSANVQTFLGAADYAAMKTQLGLTIGTDVQAYDAELAALAGLTSAADKGIYFTGAGTAGVYDLTSVARTLLAQTTQGNMRTTGLGLGSIAVLAAPAGTVVGTTDTQTLTNKTLTAPVINSPTGIVKGDVGLGNVDNTSDASKPVSTATQTALDLKVAGPATATDTAIVRYDGTTGELIQDSVVTIADTTGAITGPRSISLHGSTSGSIVFQVPATAGTNVLTFPAGTTDFSATGGSNQFVKQTSVGGALTVATIAAADIPTGVDAAKIADGTVSNAEFQYLGSVTSDIQTQINAKFTSSVTAYRLIGRYSGTSGVVEEISLGTGLQFTGSVLEATGGSLPGGSTGNVDNAVLRADGTGGSTAQNSVVIIADTTGIISGTQGVTFTGSSSGTTALVPTAAASGTLTLPAATDTLVGKATTDTFTNKTINLLSNTLTGTTAEFNTALSDGSFATLAGTEALTNKTINLASNTLTGTTAEFNTALSDGSFATLAGTETLTNKTLTSPVINSPTGIVKGDVGLGNVDNTSDVNKPISTATQTALDLKKTDSMATNKLLGRGTAATGVIEEITLGTGLSLSGTTLNATGTIGGGTGGTDNAVLRADGTGGVTVQNSVVTIADTTGVIAGTQGITISGSTSGAIALVVAAVAGTGTMTLQGGTDTLVGRATVDTLTQKTYDTAGAGNSFSINGVAVTANTGTGAVARATSPTFVTPILGVASATSLATSAASPLLLTNGQLVTVALTSQTIGGVTLTIPDFASVADTFVFTTLAQTLSNKTFVAPALGTPASGNLANCTFPTLNQSTTGSAATLTTPRTIGGVSFDGSANIVPQTIQSVNEAADTTCFPLFISASGSQSLQPLNNAGFTYNASTNALTATTFIGALTGTASGNLVSGGALGTPSSGVVTNLTGTASININGTVGATTPAAGTFTTLVAGSTTSLLLGTAGSAVGNIGFRNATSGTITLAPVTGALGAVTLSLPAATDTLVGRATTDTLTNKTLTSPTLTTPVLGTPASGTLTNCTGLPIAGLVASTSTAIGVGSIELGHASANTLTASGGVLSIEGVVIPTISSTNTLTNKTLIATTNVVEEITTTTSSATPAPTGGSLRNFFTVTALAAGATFAAPSGTPVNGNRLMIRIKDNGTARTLAFNAIYRAIGVTLPTTTVISKTMYLGCVYNDADSKWDVLATGQEA